MWSLNDRTCGSRVSGFMWTISCDYLLVLYRRRQPYIAHPCSRLADTKYLVPIRCIQHSGEPTVGCVYLFCASRLPQKWTTPNTCGDGTAGMPLARSGCWRICAPSTSRRLMDSFMAQVLEKVEEGGSRGGGRGGGLLLAITEARVVDHCPRPCVAGTEQYAGVSAPSDRE